MLEPMQLALWGGGEARRGGVVCFLFSQMCDGKVRWPYLEGTNSRLKTLFGRDTSTDIHIIEIKILSTMDWRQLSTRKIQQEKLHRDLQVYRLRSCDFQRWNPSRSCLVIEFESHQ